MKLQPEESKVYIYKITHILAFDCPRVANMVPYKKYHLGVVFVQKNLRLLAAEK